MKFNNTILIVSLLGLALNTTSSPITVDTPQVIHDHYGNTISTWTGDNNVNDDLQGIDLEGENHLVRRKHWWEMWKYRRDLDSAEDKEDELLEEEENELIENEEEEEEDVELEEGSKYRRDVQSHFKEKKHWWEFWKH